MAKRDLESHKRALSRERSLFFRMSRENQRLREYVAKLEAEAEKRK